MVNTINNKNFYPTPSGLRSKMIAKIKGTPRRTLEPSAGKGDLVEAVKSKWAYTHGHNTEIFTIEIDPDLQATLRGKGYKVLDSDFLTYTGPDKFDLIIANPPFDEGDKHLLKAIDIMYRGQIIFLLNAETLRNPHTNLRKELVRKLDELGASIEFIKDSFMEAERKTNVEVALIYIKIDRKVEDDIFAGCDDHSTRSYEKVKDKYEVSNGRTIDELVAEYDEVIRLGTETVISYYRNYQKVGKYFHFGDAKKGDESHSSTDLTDRMQNAINALLINARIDFWRRTLDLNEVRSRLTKKKQEEFEHAMTERCFMDFTQSNIRQFVLNLIGSYEQTLTEAVVDTFDTFTTRHCYDGGRFEKNIHMFNGWKTNNAFKVGRRVVVPMGYLGSFDGPFTGYNGKWELHYNTAAKLRDIDLVMSYFDGGKDYISMETAIREAFARGESSAIESTYFKMTTHKKGTIHLYFRDEDILRRFNVVACRGKNWLPGDFGSKSYEALGFDERAVVDSFEGKETYDKFVNAPLFGMNISRQMIGYDIVPEAAVEMDVPEVAAPAQQSHTEWEGDVTFAIEEKLEATTSDAQGIVEAHDFEMMQAWGMGLDPEATADKVILAATPAQVIDLASIPVASSAVYAQQSLF